MRTGPRPSIPAMLSTAKKLFAHTTSSNRRPRSPRQPSCDVGTRAACAAHARRRDGRDERSVWNTRPPPNKTYPWQSGDVSRVCSATPNRPRRGGQGLRVQPLPADASQPACAAKAKPHRRCRRCRRCCRRRRRNSRRRSPSPVGRNGRRVCNDRPPTGPTNSSRYRLFPAFSPQIV